jgi:hypothetical protein
MTAMNWTKENKGLWLAVACGVAAFGMLSTVLGSQPASVERVATISITQVLEDDLGSMVVQAVRPAADLGSMVVEAERPSGTRVVTNDRDSTKHGRKDETALQLAVGL